MQKVSPMLEAFLKQQKFTDKQADDYQKNIENNKTENVRKAMEIMGRSQNIQDYISVPTKNPIIETKTESHQNFKNYNHSLDMKRNIGLKITHINEDGEIEDSDGIIMGNLGSEDV